MMNVIILAFIYAALDAMKDSIAHKDAFKDLGTFFKRATGEARKTTFMRKYYPMFFDAWHAAKHLQYHCIGLLGWIATGQFFMYPFLVCTMSWLFIFLYKN